MKSKHATLFPLCGPLLLALDVTDSAYMCDRYFGDLGV
jgi:hypothetical protein